MALLGAWTAWLHFLPPGYTFYQIDVDFDHNLVWEGEEKF